jgi:quinolinate synthase
LPQKQQAIMGSFTTISNNSPAGTVQPSKVRAPEIASTEGIINAVKASPARTQWAVGTELHLVNRVGKKLKDHTVISLDPNLCVCTTMFRITPQHLLGVLENLGAGKSVQQISVDERTRHNAKLALDRMLALR